MTPTHCFPGCPSHLLAQLTCVASLEWPTASQTTLLRSNPYPELGSSPQFSALALSVGSSRMLCFPLPNVAQSDHCMWPSLPAACWSSPCRALARLSRLPPSFLTICWNLRLSKVDLQAEAGLWSSRKIISAHSDTVQCIVSVSQCVSVYVYVCMYVHIRVGR